MVCVALPGPAADSLAVLPPRIALGVDPAGVWRALEADAVLAPLGAPWPGQRARANPSPRRSTGSVPSWPPAPGPRPRRTRQVGVRAAVPLGLCLLPSFLLLGIVPVVAGLVAELAR